MWIPHHQRAVAERLVASIGGDYASEEQAALNHCRPCIWSGCRYHLYLDVKPNGSITLNFPDVDAEDLELLAETCALDVATEDGVTLERVGELVNLTRERVRQIEVSALAQVKRNAPRVFDVEEFVALEE
jgi:hypothetical protein